MHTSLNFCAAALAFALTPTLALSQTDAASPQETQAIANEAYTYAFAMLENYNTMSKQLADPKAREYVGGFGRFRHYAELYTPENHAPRRLASSRCFAPKPRSS